MKSLSFQQFLLNRSRDERRRSEAIAFVKSSIIKTEICAFFPSAFKRPFQESIRTEEIVVSENVEMPARRDLMPTRYGSPGLDSVVKMCPKSLEKAALPALPLIARQMECRLFIKRQALFGGRFVGTGWRRRGSVSVIRLPQLTKA
ncbi:MAG: hypothetical protein JSS81_24310 [Acidobacteria bacterium]|nr:hypothetical protein [Acidobacteriota bacterium]